MLIHFINRERKKKKKALKRQTYKLCFLVILVGFKRSAHTDGDHVRAVCVCL